MLALGALGALVSLFYGRLGFMPLDQSIVFDGGWRVLSGQVPFRDFVTPSGVVPIVMQAAVFAVAGVDWWAYLAHAALVNAAFCGVAYGLLRCFGSARGWALFYAGLSSLLLYPPIGTPYPEQHAFFFLLLALWLGARAALAPHASRAWLLLPSAVLLSYLSKQNVAAFGLIPLTLVVLLRPRGAMRARLTRLAAGTALALTACVILGVALGVDPELLSRYFFEIPASVGAQRLASLSWSSVQHRLPSLPWGSFVAVACVAAGLALTRVRQSLRSGPEAPEPTTHGAGSAASLAVALLAVCVLFAASTINQVENGLPYLFVALGLVHATHPSFASVWGGRHWRAAALLLALVAARDAYWFHAYVDLPRRVLDIEFDPARARAATIPGLRPMVHQSHPKAGIGLDDLEALLAFLAGREGGFLLFGDHSILYGLSGRPSLSPSLWYHAGLTFPSPGQSGFRDFEAWLVRSFERARPRWLIVEGERTWMGSKLSDFPELERSVRRRRRGELRVGRFRLVELGDPR